MTESRSWITYDHMVYSASGVTESPVTTQFRWGTAGHTGTERHRLDGGYGMLHPHCVLYMAVPVSMLTGEDLKY